MDCMCPMCPQLFWAEFTKCETSHLIGWHCAEGGCAHRIQTKNWITDNNFWPNQWECRLLVCHTQLKLHYQSKIKAANKEFSDLLGRNQLSCPFLYKVSWTHNRGGGGNVTFDQSKSGFHIDWSIGSQLEPYRVEIDKLWIIYLQKVIKIMVKLL